MEIDHIDTNSRNNCVDNLRVVTSKENSNNPLSKKNHSDAKKGNSNRPKKPVLQFTKDGIFVQEFESAKQAER